MAMPDPITPTPALPPYRSLLSHTAPCFSDLDTFTGTSRQHVEHPQELTTITKPAVKPASKVHQPLRAKTGISITEIVDSEPAESAMSALGKKRKATEISSAISEPTHHVHTVQARADIPATASTALDQPASTIAATSMSALAKTEPSPKKARLQLAATAVAGAMIGSLGMLATLATLPDGFFQ